MSDVINNKLSWNGSHLGNHPETRMIGQWEFQGTIYSNIYLGNGRSEGNIYCIATQSEDLFPCIVEDIKELFGIVRRGIHRITISGREYIIYNVPISKEGEVIWETPLNRLDAKNPLRNDATFRRDVQRVIAFCDIMALCGTGESSIIIRPGVEGKFIPISVNEKRTVITKSSDYDYSILSKRLFLKWFGEDTSINDIVKEMVHYQSGRNQITGIENSGLSAMGEQKQLIIPVVKILGGNFDNLTLISVNMRNKINEIIESYDGNYIWYSNFIIDRMSRRLLIDS